MPEAWRAFEESDLSLNAAESLAYNTALLKEGEAERLPKEITKVTARVRGAIRSNRSNVLDADPDTLPLSALDHAAAIIRYNLLSNFPGGVSTPREKQYNDAIQWLRDVAKGDYLIEGPGDADATPAPPKARPSISVPTLTQKRTDASGS